jgi:hypothetical protein
MKNETRSTGRLVWNVAALNIGWFSCVLGAAAGLHWLGAAVVGLWVGGVGA